MKWVRMRAPPGSIILNTGDYLQRITNDVIPSTTHRVAPPRDPELRSRCRTSFPMAVYLNEDVVLRPLPSCGPPKYPPESAIDFHCKITSKYCEWSPFYDTANRALILSLLMAVWWLQTGRAIVTQAKIDHPGNMVTVPITIGILLTSSITTIVVAQRLVPT